MVDWLVPDWKQAWRWLSIHAFAFNIALMTTWIAFPDDMKNYLPGILPKVISIFALCLGVLGRLVKQDKKND